MQEVCSEVGQYNILQYQLVSCRFMLLLFLSSSASDVNLFNSSVTKCKYMSAPIRVTNYIVSFYYLNLYNLNSLRITNFYLASRNY